MKITRRQLRKLIAEAAMPFDRYYNNYLKDMDLGNELYQMRWDGDWQYSPELQDLLRRAAASEFQNLDNHLLTTLTSGVDRLIIHRMLKGEMPMDREFILYKMNMGNRFASDMSSGRYGRLD